MATHLRLEHIVNLDVIYYGNGYNSKHPTRALFNRVIRQPLLTYKGTESGMKLFEPGSTGTGMSSMESLLAGRWSIHALHLTSTARLKTTAQAVVSHSRAVHYKTHGKISSRRNTRILTPAYTITEKQQPGLLILGSILPDALSP